MAERAAVLKDASGLPDGVESPFAGVSACRECHQDRVDEYKQTPHFRTLRTPEQSRPVGPFTSEGAELSTRNKNLRFQMQERGDGFYVTANDQGGSESRRIESRVDLIVGSGRIFEGYLSFEGNALYQIPVGYFTAGNRWSNCPGFEDGTADFARPILPRCLDCHGTWARMSPEGKHHYEPTSILPGLACERCHGSGKAHIAWHRANPEAEEAAQIIKPATLPPERRLDLCGQCHGDPGTLLAPAFSYRPGTPLEDYVKQDQTHGDASFVHTANQVQRLKASPCYVHTQDIDCTDCHNPHRFDPSALREATLDACARCHAEKPCGLSDSLHEELRPQCISCHMPSRSAILTTLSEKEDDYQDVVRLLDHTINIHPLESDVTRLRFLDSRGDPAAVALRQKVRSAYRLRFHRLMEKGAFVEAASHARQLASLDAADASELLDAAKEGQTLKRRLDSFIQTALSGSSAEQTLYFNRAVSLHTLHPLAAGPRALVTLAGYFLDQGHTDRALQACIRATEIIPAEEAPELLADLAAHHGAALLRSRRTKDARIHLERALRLEPDHATASLDLARVLLALNHFADALPVIKRRLEQQPENTTWLNLLAQAQAQTGASDDAVASLYASLAIAPKQPDALFLLGRILALLGRRREALEHLSECSRLAQLAGNRKLHAKALALLRQL